MYIEKLHKLWLCQNNAGGIHLTPKMANRHGLIAGATGTGKTVTLKVMAEGFSEMGVPVFLADIKGDVSGMCMPGENSEGFQKRLKTKLDLDMDWKFQGYPVRFWDVYGKQGLPVRTTVSDMGPDLLSRLLELNDTQTGVMNIIFRVADDNGLLLDDLKDLRQMLLFVGENASELKLKYGNVSAQSIGAIQRSLLRLEDQGGDTFFGLPELDIKDWFGTDENGKGIINLLHCTELFQNPLLYSTFLLWMLSELYEMMPEAGDLDKPKMVFFFDEAHLIFKDAPRSLLDKVEQIVRLIRSKGIGIYFITQQPTDIPDKVLAQLGNKLQHALRAYTPKERKSLKATAESFRQNPDIDAEAALSELGTGEVLVSLLNEEGTPQMVQRAYVMPPRSYLGTASDELRKEMIIDCPLYNKYIDAIDRDSAFEILNQDKENADREIREAKERAAAEKEAARRQMEEEREAERQAKAEEKERLAAEREEARRLKEEERARAAAEREEARRQREEEREAARQAKEAERAQRATARQPKSFMEKVADTALSSIGRSIGTSIARGILGSILKR